MSTLDEAVKRLEADLADGEENGFYSGGGYHYMEALPEDIRSVLDALSEATERHHATVRRANDLVTQKMLLTEERDELAAVIERAKGLFHGDGFKDSPLGRILDSVPADVLRERDAETEIALLERLADEIENSPTSDSGTAWFNKDMAEWLRTDKVNELRKEQSDDHR